MNNDDMDKPSIRKQDSLAADASTQPRQFFRASRRVFCLNGEWYFQTRESDHGPFTRREAAELALQRYVDEMQDIALLSGSYPSFEKSEAPGPSDQKTQPTHANH